MMLSSVMKVSRCLPGCRKCLWVGASFSSDGVLDRFFLEWVDGEDMRMYGQKLYGRSLVRKQIGYQLSLEAGSSKL